MGDIKARGTALLHILTGRRILGVQLAIATAAVALLVDPAVGAANNDPHRSFAAATPFDLPAGYCAFPVHLTFPVDREYMTASSLPDGSTVQKFTGAFTVSATNAATGKSVAFNASGPGTLTLSPDGSSGLFENQGLFLLYASNATQYGLPSNLVITTGSWSFGEDMATNSITSATRQPHVLTDVCAALS